MRQIKPPTMILVLQINHSRHKAMGYGFLLLFLALVASIYVYSLNSSNLIPLVPISSSFLALLYIVQLWRKASTKPTNKDKKLPTPKSGSPKWALE